jgi:hypothetical protein
MRYPDEHRDIFHTGCGSPNDRRFSRLQNQRLERGVIRPSYRDKKSGGSGNYRISVETIYQYAITSECTKLGIPARRAAEAARLFSVAQPGRAANELFPFGRTLLKLKSTGAEIVNADFNASLTDVVGRPFESTTLIEIGPIVGAVDQALALRKDTQ